MKSEGRAGRLDFVVPVSFGGEQKAGLAVPAANPQTAVLQTDSSQTSILRVDFPGESPVFSGGTTCLTLLV